MKPVNIWHHQSQLDRSPYFDWAGFCVRAAAPVRCAEGDPTTSRGAADCIHQHLPPHSHPQLPQSEYHQNYQFGLRQDLCCHSLLNCISLCINTCFGCCFFWSFHLLCLQSLSVSSLRPTSAVAAPLCQDVRPDSVFYTSISSQCDRPPSGERCSLLWNVGALHSAS